MSRAASLLHSILGDKPLLQGGCCTRLCLKASQKKTSGLISLKPLGCLSPSIIWGLYLCKKSSFKANLLHSLLRREGEGEDPSLELCAGLKSYLNSLTGKWGSGTDPQHIHIPPIQTSCGVTSVWSKPGHLPYFGGAFHNSSLNPTLAVGRISNPFTLHLPEFKQHWTMQWSYSLNFKLFQKSLQWTANQECNIMILL